MIGNEMEVYVVIRNNENQITIWLDRFLKLVFSLFLEFITQWTGCNA
jgi:hypothetical protein